jgi:prepilin-type processing-associated H-X9-DG protein
LAFLLLLLLGNSLERQPLDIRGRQDAAIGPSDDADERAFDHATLLKTAYVVGVERDVPLESDACDPTDTWVPRIGLLQPAQMANFPRWFSWRFCRFVACLTEGVADIGWNLSGERFRAGRASGPADPEVHYSLWHPPVCHFLFCDGHVAGLVREEIKKNLFHLNIPPEG